jgi:YD repeat-containing protein
MSLMKLLPNIVLAIGLVSLIVVSMPSGAANALSPEAAISGATQSSTSTRQDGSVETQTYNPFTGSRDTVTHPDGSSRTTTWDAEGHKTSTTYNDPNSGYQDTVKFDQNGKMVSEQTKSKDGSTQISYYDPSGHKTSDTTTDPSGNQRTAPGAEWNHRHKNLLLHCQDCKSVVPPR